jgi:multiple sugar transport system ATP-binding protein
MAEIEFVDVTKRYADGFEAVKHMNVKIEDGEFMILVGPSGCGKSTALRMIAGLEEISDGELRIGGKVVNELGPKERDIAMVFQSYALYPHMTVRDNMGFALKLAGESKETINRRVEDAARILDLDAHLDRKPANLSGGQRQRVAMGRAIVREPSAYLMDEPLSNLDAKLRVQMRTEVARIQRRTSTTTVYVTHDQTEALTLGDRVAVMRAGIVQQVDTPKVLYQDPANLFVAGFIGSPSMNFFPAELADGHVTTPIGALPITGRIKRQLDSAGTTGRTLIAGLRPEHIHDADLLPADQRSTGAMFEATVRIVESMGSELYAYFDWEGEAARATALQELAADAGAQEVPGAAESQAVARIDVASEVREGANVRLWFDPSDIYLFEAEDGRSLSRPDAVGATAGV